MLVHEEEKFFSLHKLEALTKTFQHWADVCIDLPTQVGQLFRGKGRLHHFGRVSANGMLIQSHAKPQS